MFLSDLEVDRGRSQGRADVEVVRLKEVADAVKEQDGSLPPRGPRLAARCVKKIADDRGLTVFDVGADFPIAVADILRGYGLGVRWVAAPFVAERAIKTDRQIDHIRAAIRHTEAAMRLAIDRIRAAGIEDGRLVENGEPLTAEMVKRTVNLYFLDADCFGYDCIVAGGEQGIDPHDRGSGPLPANAPIILDIFPRDNKTRYHGDMTRTVVRGKATKEATRMFEAVAAAKAAAESMLKDGVDGHDVHKAVEKVFEDREFVTEQRDGRMVGFFHGTGHGLGLAVHEYPGLGAVHNTIRAGHVVTVEPGLYYPGVGGVRIEDDVVVREQGCENLCELEVEFEI